jgi:prevent-host-death family protein
MLRFLMCKVDLATAWHSFRALSLSARPWADHVCPQLRYDVLSHVIETIIVIMITVPISDLKADLSRHLREVRRGGEIQVLERGTPVARLVTPRKRTTTGFATG